MKKTQLLICVIVSMTVMSLYGLLKKELELRERMRQGDVTSAEAEQIVYTCVDKIVQSYKMQHDLLGDGYEYFQLGYDAFPTLYKILGDDKKMQDAHYIHAVGEAFWVIDGKNPASEGKKEALDWTRRIVAIHTNPPSSYAGRYLAAKGNASDITLLRQYGYDDFATALEMRLALPPPTPDIPQADGIKPDVAPRVKQPSENKPTPSPPTRYIWFYIAILSFVAILGGAVVWLKAKRK